jgi:FkbM family methyltransferase
MALENSQVLNRPVVAAPSESWRRYRRILAAGLAGIFGKGINLLVSTVTIPLTLRYLGSNGFGLWTAISSAVAMFYVFDVGIATTLTNLISKSFAENDEDSAATHFATALWLVLSISALLGAVGWILWPHIDWASIFNVPDPSLARETGRAVAAAFVVFLCALPAGLAPRVLAGYQQTHAANLFAAAGSILSLLAIIVVIGLHGSLTVLVAAYAASMPAAQVASLVWMCFKRPWMKPWPSLFRRNLFGAIFHSGSQFFLIQIAGLVVFNSDNLVISHFLSPSQVTPYNVTWRLVSYVTAVPILFVPALWPAYAEAHAKGDLAWIQGAYARSRWTTLAVLGAGCAIFLAAGQRIIRLWAGPAAVPSTALLALMCVWMVIFAITLYQSCLMGATSRVARQAVYGPAAAVVNLALSVVWVRTFGSLGVLLATVVSYVAFVLAPQAWEVKRILRGDFLPVRENVGAGRNLPTDGGAWNNAAGDLGASQIHLHKREDASNKDMTHAARRNHPPSRYPDKLLRLANELPWPINALAFRGLLRAFRSRGKATGAHTLIQFGKVEITAPLEHPAVYWRYRPKGFNRNFLLAVQRTLEVRKGLIIDVGANIGDGVALLRAAGVDAPVLAIEGADVWFDLLKSNTAGMADVEIENVFLGSGEGNHDLSLDVHDGTSKLIVGGSGIELTSLDVLMDRHKQHPVAMVKTDTDGFDAKVLFGARKLLAAQRPVVFAEVDEGLLREQGNSAQELLEFLTQCGYSHLTAWNNGGNWLASRPISQGIADLIARYPGGANTSYLDVAAFSESDRAISYSFGADSPNEK